MLKRAERSLSVASAAQALSPIGLAVLLGAAPLVAQDASIPTPDGQAFLGEWTATVLGPEGSIEIHFDLVDDGGQLVGEISGGGNRGMILIEEILKSGSDLILQYRMDVGSQGFQVALSLSLDRPGLVVTLTGGGGGFTAKGTAHRR